MPILPPTSALFRTVLALAAAATLSACASTHREDPTTGALTPTEQWANKVSIDAHPEELLLAVHADGLSLNQAQALQSFVQNWASDEAGTIRVRTPLARGLPPQAAAEADRMALSARDFLVAQGAPAHRVEIAAYDSTGAASAPVVVAYDRYQATTPVCGENIENLTRTMMNRPMTNFGCAVNSNIAAQLANPEDLLRARGSEPVDAARRGVVLGKYRRGELTASPREEQAVGTVSKAVN